MKKNGAFLAIHALEQIGVRKTFGIPGLYNSPLYEHLFKSIHIEPIIVCSELSAGYMADVTSRTTESIGVIVTGQGAGVSNLVTALAQCFDDGIPILVISGSNKIPGKDYQMHSMSINCALDSLVKNSYKVSSVDEIIPTIYQAYDLAMEGCPGPVFIDIPVELQSEMADLPQIAYISPEKTNQNVKEIDSPGIQLFAESETIETKIEKSVMLLSKAEKPGIFVGWGALKAFDEVKQIAEMLAIPVCTTVQGISAFPHSHPLHTGIGFGNYAVPAAQNAFKNCDCLIAIGLRFSELSTGNFQMPVPENLIHIDIDPQVFHKNYYAKVAISGNCKDVLSMLIKEIVKKGFSKKNKLKELASSIQNDKQEYKKSWLSKSNEQLVSPGFFFNALRNYFPDETILIIGNGSHKFAAAELFPVLKQREFICPTGTDSLGYGVPAAIAAKLVNKNKTVIGIVSETNLMVNGLEMITAQYYKLGIIVFIIRDWITDQNQAIEKGKNLTISSEIKKSLDIESYAGSVHANFFVIRNDIDISGAMTKAKELIKRGKNVIIEVDWDCSRKTAFESGATKTDLSRISFFEKIKILFKGKE
jgi:acetolactate synthase-1/2/3 large subunit